MKRTVGLSLGMSFIMLALLSGNERMQRIEQEFRFLEGWLGNPQLMIETFHRCMKTETKTR